MKKKQLFTLSLDVLFNCRDTPEPQGDRCKLFQLESTSTPAKSVIDETKLTVPGVSEISDIAKLVLKHSFCIILLNE